MPKHAYERLNSGQPLAGLFIVSDRLPVRAIIDEHIVIDAASETAEWAGMVAYLPL